MQVVNVCACHQAVHGGVNRWSGPAFSEQTEIKCRDHLVFVLGTAVHLGQRPHGVKTKSGETTKGQRAEVTARTFDPHDFDVVAARGIAQRGFRRCVTAGVIGVSRIGAQTMRTL